DLVLFGFEDPADVKNWSNLLVDAPVKHPSTAYGEKEHPVRFELATEGATSGKHSLKLTFSGGRFPAITTTKLSSEDLTPYKRFEADITASRTCVVLFRILDEKSTRDSDKVTNRWEKAALVHAGKNHVCDAVWVNGKAVAFDI